MIYVGYHGLDWLISLQLLVWIDVWLMYVFHLSQRLIKWLLLIIRYLSGCFNRPPSEGVDDGLHRGLEDHRFGSDALWCRSRIPRPKFGERLCPPGFSRGPNTWRSTSRPFAVMCFGIDLQLDHLWRTVMHHSNSYTNITCTHGYVILYHIFYWSLGYLVVFEGLMF